MGNWDESKLDESIDRLLKEHRRKVIVLDDDPTGVQTVHGIRVLTSLDDGLLEEAMLSPDTMFYILTNSRGLKEEEAALLNRKISGKLLSLSAATGTPFTVISRGDSTLRGHYPLEIDVLADSLKPAFDIDGHFLIPAFFEGGRITSENIHYYTDRERFVPVNRSEFAADPVFGFRNADLRLYIEEKSKGRISADEVLCISLSDLREGGPDKVFEIVMGMNNGRAGIVNAENETDLKVFTAGLLRAEASGKRLLFRTAASFVKIRGGIKAKPLLQSAELAQNSLYPASGGLIMVGSHVAKSTSQLKHFIANCPHVQEVELDVPGLLVRQTREQVVAAASDRVNDWLKQGEHVVVYTSRSLIQAEADTANMAISQSVSQALVEVVRRLEVRPRFLISKGGITSSDIATKGLEIRSAEVLGQAAIGVSVWKCGPETKFPGLPYIVFPGNVGADDTLTEVALKCMGENNPEEVK